MAQFNLPESIDVFVPKLGRTVSVAVGTAAEDVVLHLIQHGIKQKLVDSTAGINSSDFDTKEAYSAAVDKAVAARLETVLTIPSERAFGPRDPVQTEARRLIAALLRKWGIATKAADAAEQTSTFEKAKLAFSLAIRKLGAAKNPNATAAELGDMVERNWIKLVKEPAEKIVAERQSATAEVDLG